MPEAARPDDPFAPRLSAFSLWARKLGCSEGQLYTMVIGVLLTFMVSANALPAVAWHQADAAPAAGTPATADETPGTSPSAPPVPSAAFDAGSPSASFSPTGGSVADDPSSFGAGEPPPFPAPGGSPEGGAEPPPSEPPPCPAAAIVEAARGLPAAPTPVPAADVVDRLAEAAGCSTARTSVGLVAIAFDAGGDSPRIPGSNALLSSAAAGPACALADSLLAALAMAHVGPAPAPPAWCLVLSPAPPAIPETEFTR